MTFQAKQKQDHWADNIFEDLPVTKLPGPPKIPSCDGPPSSSPIIPPDLHVLFRLQLNFNSLSISCLCSRLDPSATELLIRYTDEEGVAQYSQHELYCLCISRKKRGVKITRWSEQKQRPKQWCYLSWKTWEEIVLFHAIFLVLKANHPDTIKMAPEEYSMKKRETCWFQE